MLTKAFDKMVLQTHYICRLPLKIEGMSTVLPINTGGSDQ